MATLKAGCYLVNKELKSVAVIYREKQKDYSFPKGHTEEGETIEETALRETAEETKRDAEIVKKFQPYIEEYTTPLGERCVCYMFIALDKGKSNNNSEDTHFMQWVPFDEVEEKLSYESLRKGWNSVKENILSIFN